MSGTPYLVGSNTGGTGSNQIAVTVTSDVASQDSIVVGALSNASGFGPLSVVDTAGNTYTLATSDAVQTTAGLYIFTCNGANPLKVANGDAVIVSYSGTSSVRGAIVVGDNNVISADKIVITHGSSTTPASPASGTLSQAEEHAIAFIVDANGGVPTWVSPWSSTVLANVTSGTTRLSAAYRITSATTSITASASITSVPWTAGMITNKVNPVSITTVLSDGVKSDPYSQVLAATGGDGSYTWSISSGSLPTGVSLSGSTISGTPSVSGTFTFTVTATDGHSSTASSVQTITLLPSTAAVVASSPLPGNILTRADSDFSTASSTPGSWTGVSATVSLGSTAQLTGSHSLIVDATSQGAAAQASTHNSYPVIPDSGYVVSGYLLPPSTGQVQIGMIWKDHSGTIIRTDWGALFGGTPLVWTPVNAALTSPSSAVTAELTVQCATANVGDLMHGQLFYMAHSESQVLVDWNNGTASSGSTAGSMFMDVTPWVRMDQGMTLMRGRQDSVSEILAGSGSFSLQNDQGYFTKFKSASLVHVLGGDVTLQRRCQINLTDETGTWHTRADGPISGLNYTGDNTGNTNILQVSTTDVLTPLNRESSLSCWTREQVLSNGPLLHWALNDSGASGGTGIGAESSGNNGPALRVRNSDKTSAAKISWGDSTGGVETLADAISPASTADGSAYWAAGSNQPNSLLRGLDAGVAGPVSTPLANVNLVPVLSVQANPNTFVSNKGFSLRAPLGKYTATPNAVGSDYSFEVYFTIDPLVAADNTASFNYGPYCVMSLLDSSSGVSLIGYISTTNVTSHLNFNLGLYPQPPSFTVANFSANTTPSTTAHVQTSLVPDTVDPLPHHLVIQITGDTSSPTVNGWLDGELIDASGFTLAQNQTFDTLVLGADPDGMGCHFGSLSCCQVYDYLLTQDQVTQDCRMGQYGMWEATTDDCIGRIATYASIPAYWNNVSEQHNGLSLTEYQDITGSNPLTDMQLFEQSEQGLLFVDAGGLLQFHTRDWRMGYGAPDLLLPPDTFDGDMGYQVVDQFMVNEQGVASGVFTTGTGYINRASQDEYGAYASSTATSPTQLPVISWSRTYTQLGLSSFDFNATPNMSDMAAFAPNARSQPWLLPAQLTFDLETLSKDSTGVGISDLYALEIDMMVSPDGELPDSFPDINLSYEWFIEGVQETINHQSRTLQFYTSPAEAQRCWIPGDATYGVLSSTARLGVSAADTSVPVADGKDVSHDAGGPYWPPAFDNTGLNNPSGDGHSFIGANDIRGLTDTTRRMLNPPMWIVGASTAQPFASGQLVSPQVFWDTVHVDSEGGMGIIPGWPNWYVVTVPGYYDLDAYLQWHALNVAGTVAQGYFVIAQAAAQRVAAGSGTPPINGFYVCPVGSQMPTINGSTSFPGNNVSTRVYLGLGDMVTLAGEQTTGSSQNSGSQYGGSVFSGVWRGYATSDDQVQINSSITGGTISTGGGQGGISTGSPPSNQTGERGVTFATAVKSYANTHTYSYYGSPKGFRRRNSDGTCFQGTPGGGKNTVGSMTSQIGWPADTIVQDLTGATILKVTLKATNTNTWYNSGARMLLGWGAINLGAGTWDAHSGGGHRDVIEIGWSKHQEKTVVLDAAWIDHFISSGATYFTLGMINGDTDLNRYGEWKGGIGQWTLEVTYKVEV